MVYFTKKKFKKLQFEINKKCITKIKIVCCFFSKSVDVEYQNRLTMDDFFITLISNSSLNYYPNNSTSNFTVQLPKKIELNDEWRVGLAEIHYNYNFFNITENNNNFIITEISHHTQFTKHGIKTGFYSDVDDILQLIQQETEKKFGKWIEYDIWKKQIIITKTDEIKSLMEKGSDFKIEFEGRLAMQLGFPPNTNVLDYTTPPYTCCINFGIPDQIFIYSDIIEPQFIGDKAVQVLRIVNNKYNEYGASIFTEFKDIQYVNLMKKQFESINIILRDTSGSLYPFLHGISTVKLHFKRK